MTLNTEYLIGRRFEFVNGSAPDVTFTGADDSKGIRAHCVDGSRGWMDVAAVLAAVDAGALVESARGVPFVHPREQPARFKRFAGAQSGLRTGIAGRGKVLLWPNAAGVLERL